MRVQMTMDGCFYLYDTFNNKVIQSDLETKQKTLISVKRQNCCWCGIQKRRTKASWDLVKSMDPKIYLQFKFQFECGSGATEQLSVEGAECE